MDLVGGVPPLPPGACRRVAAWASALPALSRAWPEHTVGRLGAALAALLQPGEPHFRPVALALPPPRDFLDFCVSGSMRLEAALLRGLESSTAFAQALATFEALAFPPEAEGAPRPPVPERGALVAVGRACGPVAALQQPRRPGNVAAFVEDAGPGRAAWLLALLGEAVVHRAALRGGATGWEGGGGGALEDLAGGFLRLSIRRVVLRDGRGCGPGRGGRIRPVYRGATGRRPGSGSPLLSCLHRRAHCQGPPGVGEGVAAGSAAGLRQRYDRRRVLGGGVRNKVRPGVV